MEANNEFDMSVNEDSVNEDNMNDEINNDEINNDEVVTDAETVTVAKRKIPVGTTETVKHHARKTVVKAKETTAAMTDGAKLVGDSAKSTVSKIDLLNLHLPKVDLPKLSRPKFDMPKFDMPKFDMPKFELPKVEMPSMASVGEVKAEVTKVAYEVRGKAASAVTLVREAVGI